MSTKSKGRKTLLLNCPYCSHEQSEPAVVLSTYCRKCSSHYQVIDGQPMASGTPMLHPTADLIQTVSAVLAGLDPSLKSSPPTPVEKLPDDRTTEHGLSFQPNGTETRQCEHENEIECLDCGHQHEVSLHSSSSLCPRCGSYTSLQHYEIRETWTRQIRTRGNVHLHENGSVTGASVTCRNLTVEGRFNGAIDCSGDLVIRRSCRILGRVRCRRLIIENQATVTCESGIQADEVIVDGAVQADITCHGRLELARNASLKGDITIAKLVISQGAAHQGRVSMVRERTR